MEDLQLEDLIADVVDHPVPERVPCAPTAPLTAPIDVSTPARRQLPSIRHFFRKWLH